MFDADALDEKPDVGNPDWPGWRGANRDGRVRWLPDALPDAAEFIWEVPLASDGIGGIAVADGIVVVGSRDFTDQNDVFQCFDADTGEELWQLLYPAPGRLDYGNSPRATPQFHKGRIYLLGAFGHLNCVEPEFGLPEWTRQIAEDFGSPDLDWGLSGTPLIIDDRLIVQPGGRDASLVALDPQTGATIWKSPGLHPSYSSFIRASIGGVKQVVGFDDETLGGWDPETGKRLWTVPPQTKGDFNVPTPILLKDGLLLSTENNGTRIHRFGDGGTVRTQRAAQNADLMPDAHTPVVANGCVYGITNGLRCLDLEDGLKERWVSEDDAFFTYGSLIASEHRLLAFNLNCELVLLSANRDKPEILDRLKLVDDRTESHAHPAIVGTRLFARLGPRLVCLELDGRNATR